MPRKNASPVRNVDALRAAAATSYSLAEVGRKLGLRGQGHYKVMREVAEENGIELPRHGRGFSGDGRGGQFIPLVEILVENSTYKTGLLLGRLVDAGLRTEVCEECGQGPSWNGRPLRLQVHHRNGLRDDHRIENLQVLCPNCHTQTDTFAGRNCIPRRVAGIPSTL